MKEIVPSEGIMNKIYVIRGIKVMLDRDLAGLYEVETKVLKQAVRRNIKRFPEDFMFELTKEEFNNWRSQIVTSNSDKMGLRYSPMAFTEHGVAMLSAVLNSKRAIDVNIQIFRAFNQLRKAIISTDKLQNRIQQLEEIFDINIRLLDSKIDKNSAILQERIKKNTDQIQLLINLLISPEFEPEKGRQIGFEVSKEKRKKSKKN